MRTATNQGDICFATASCALGVMLLAQSSRGVCAVFFGGDEKILVQQLQQAFPDAKLQQAQTALKAALAEVIAVLENPKALCLLPLDTGGSAFEQQVWQALRQIAPGATASYSEIAQRIGKPRAVRAVASACARNRLALLIPCHRVVRRDGTLAGYRWGMERKRMLLAQEVQLTWEVTTASGGLPN